MNKRIISVIATILAVAASGASAQIMLDPSTIVATAGSTFGPDDARFDVTNLIDGQVAEGNRDEHMGTHYLALQGTFQETVRFVFGADYDIASLKVLNTSNTGWNDSETDFFTIATSVDGGVTFSDPSAEIALQDFSEGFQDVPISAGFINGVELVIRNEMANDQGTTDARVGLNEVQFFGNPIPEPSSLAFLGLSAVFLLKRRR